MKKSQAKVACQICHKKFPHAEMYPVHFLRDSVLQSLKTHYPDIAEAGHICQVDVRKLNALHFEQILKKQKGTLSDLEKEVLDSFRDQDLLTENINEEFEERSRLADRLSDHLARFGGSWGFISAFIFVLVVWMAMNSVALFTGPFDPYPFIFLNLILSCLAAIQAPIIMMSQNRQAEKDRVKFDHEYIINLKAELQVRQINAKLDFFLSKLWHQFYDLLEAMEEKNLVEKPPEHANIKKKSDETAQSPF